jgi:hypothetical protein
MTIAPHGHLPRPCMELGVCQSRTPACSGCDHPAREKLATPPAPMRLAPSVIDGPYCREKPLTVWAQKAATALKQVASYLMGPTP